MIILGIEAIGIFGKKTKNCISMLKEILEKKNNLLIQIFAAEVVLKWKVEQIQEKAVEIVTIALESKDQRIQTIATRILPLLSN